MQRNPATTKIVRAKNRLHQRAYRQRRAAQVKDLNKTIARLGEGIQSIANELTALSDRVVENDAFNSDRVVLRHLRQLLDVTRSLGVSHEDFSNTADTNRQAQVMTAVLPTSLSRSISQPQTYAEYAPTDIFAYGGRAPSVPRTGFADEL